jgi:hypothetical protein
LGQGDKEGMKFVVALVFALAISSVRAENWSDTDRNLAITAMILHAIDWRQTHQIVKPGNGVHETNPILGDDPSRGEINAYFLGTSLLMIGLAHVLPEIRRPLLWGYIAVGTVTVVRNHIVFGIRIGM